MADVVALAAIDAEYSSKYTVHVALSFFHCGMQLSTHQEYTTSQLTNALIDL